MDERKTRKLKCGAAPNAGLEGQKMPGRLFGSAARAFWLCLGKQSDQNRKSRRLEALMSSICSLAICLTFSLGIRVSSFSISG